MNTFLFAELSLRGAAEAVTNNPLASIGWTAGIYAVLRIIWANYKEQLPTFLAAILSKIPGFGPFAPAVVPTVSTLIQQLVDEMLRQKIPAEKAHAIGTRLIADIVPEMNKADVNSLTKSVSEKCGVAPTPVAGG